MEQSGYTDEWAWDMEAAEGNQSSVLDPVLQFEDFPLSGYDVFFNAPETPMDWDFTNVEASLGNQERDLIHRNSGVDEFPQDITSPHPIMNTAERALGDDDFENWVNLPTSPPLTAASLAGKKATGNFKTGPSSRRFTTSQTAALDAWLCDHMSYPYPTPEENISLAEATGLSTKQIRHWFSRTRQRKIPAPDNTSDPLVGHPEPAAAPLSLEVCPASPNISTPRDDLCASESELSDGSLKLNRTETAFSAHAGSMIEWWLETLPAAAEPYHRSCSRQDLGCIGRRVMERRYTKFKESAPDRFRIIPNFYADYILRASFRLAQLMDFYSPEAVDFLVSCLSEVVMDIYNDSDVSVLNEIDCMPTTHPDIDELISRLKTETASLMRGADSPQMFQQALMGSKLAIKHDIQRLLEYLENGSSWSPGATNSQELVLGAFGDGHVESPRDFDMLRRDSSSVASGSTTGSYSSACSYTSFGKRKGRRRPTAGPLFLERPDQSRDRVEGKRPTFRCKSCSKGFARMSSLRRHVESIHEPRKTWICAKVPTYPQCLFCDIDLDDGGQSSCQHKPATQACWRKATHQRTFYRKDALKAHFCGTHKAANNSFAVRNPACFMELAMDLGRSRQSDDDRHIVVLLGERWFTFKICDDVGMAHRILLAVPVNASMSVQSAAANNSFGDAQH